jgi:hypothetical protein
MQYPQPSLFNDAPKKGKAQQPSIDILQFKKNTAVTLQLVHLRDTARFAARLNAVASSLAHASAFNTVSKSEAF